MADARALLKAKRLERGAAAKPQRIAPVRRDDRPTNRSKRKLEPASTTPSVPEARVAPSDGPDGKRRRVEGEDSTPEPSSSGFPADFFSDSSRSIPVADDDADADDDANETPPIPYAPQPVLSSVPFTLIPAHTSTVTSRSIDEEYEAFQRALQQQQHRAKAISPDQAAFSHATISAEAELITEPPSGFPPTVLEPGSGAAQPASESAPRGDAKVEEDETEIDKSRKRLQEERELIMDRLLDEERAQEDADAKVSALKARLQAIKLKRAARKAGA